jgi:hypothetical protein
MRVAIKGNAKQQTIKEKFGKLNENAAKVYFKILFENFRVLVGHTFSV